VDHQAYHASIDITDAGIRDSLLNDLTIV